MRVSRALPQNNAECFKCFYCPILAALTCVHVGVPIHTGFSRPSDSDETEQTPEASTTGRGTLWRKTRGGFLVFHEAGGALCSPGASLAPGP